MMDEKAIKVRALLASEDFAREIEPAETINDLCEAFKKHGVELSSDEVSELCVAIANRDATEMKADDLEKVSGGSALLTGAAFWVAGAVITYGAGWVFGRFVRNHSGVCQP